MFTQDFSLHQPMSDGKKRILCTGFLSMCFLGNVFMSVCVYVLEKTNKSAFEKKEKNNEMVKLTNLFRTRISTPVRDNCVRDFLD